MAYVDDIICIGVKNVAHGTLKELRKHLLIKEYETLDEEESESSFLGLSLIHI